ncbi:MAG TPA: hypothetical protein VK038_00615 [Ornithinicoccus sp.]|nr:hypothetical protein [Ornithinicoccus sp.]
MGLNMSKTAEAAREAIADRIFYRVRRAGDRWAISMWRDTPAAAVPVAHRVSYRELLAVLARVRHRETQTR